MPRKPVNFLHLAAALVILLAVYFVFNPARPTAHAAAVVVESCTSVHLHAELKIFIDGEERKIPSEVGIKVGKVIDTELSGSSTSPIHTHDETGVLHVENICVEKKSETGTLGYFFQVWGQPFNSTCILDRCAVGIEQVKLLVNGAANNEYDSYKIREGDLILITIGEPVIGKAVGLKEVRAGL